MPALQELEEKTVQSYATTRPIPGSDTSFLSKLHIVVRRTVGPLKGLYCFTKGLNQFRLNDETKFASKAIWLQVLAIDGLSAGRFIVEG